MMPEPDIARYRDSLKELYAALHYPEENRAEYYMTNLIIQLIEDVTGKRVVGMDFGSHEEVDLVEREEG